MQFILLRTANCFIVTFFVYSFTWFVTIFDKYDLRFDSIWLKFVVWPTGSVFRSLFNPLLGKHFAIIHWSLLQNLLTYSSEPALHFFCTHVLVLLSSKVNDSVSLFVKESREILSLSAITFPIDLLARSLVNLESTTRKSLNALCAESSFWTTNSWPLN